MAGQTERQHDVFPELKRSGFIEALEGNTPSPGQVWFPELKRSGFIEARAEINLGGAIVGFPELKRSGFIEAAI